MAIGNPTIELYLNKYFYNTKNMPPVIFTWLEAYGIGGHALLTNNKNRNGCLECLFTPPEKDIENYGKYNRSSFAKKGQEFSKAISGCGSLFTPYGSLDAIQTAILAVRLAINVLDGHEIDNPILSWKGDSQMFLENKKILSDRYRCTVEQLYENRYKYKSDLCPICRL